MLVLALFAVAGFSLGFWAHGFAQLTLVNALVGMDLGTLISVSDSIAITGHTTRPRGFRTRPNVGHDDVYRRNDMYWEATSLASGRQISCSHLSCL